MIALRSPRFLACACALFLALIGTNTSSQQPAARATGAEAAATDDKPVSRRTVFQELAAAKDEEAPLSKDSLFGTSPAKEEEAPLSKDSLFGESAAAKPPAAPGPGVKVGGFFDGLGAYTYADPEHWSRAVGRFALSAQGSAGGGVKWKVGGRLDVDPVYWGSNQYPDAVKHDQRFSAIWGENYVDFDAGNWDFRIGAQHIVWGEVVGLFYADVVSAHDMRDFLLPSFDVIRIPQGAVRAEYFSGDSHLELIWIPIPTFDRIGKPGADFYPVPLPTPLAPEVAALFRDPERPQRTLENSNFGARVNNVTNGWDWAAFAYRSFSVAPTFYVLPSTDPTQPFVVQPRYDRIWQGGGTVTKDFGSVVLRAETVYTHGLGYSLADLRVGDNVVKRSTLDTIVGLDFPMPDDIRLNVQGFDRVFFGGSSDDLAIRNSGFGASVLLSKKFVSLEPQILWIQSFEGGGGMIRPRLNWYSGKNTVLAFGADVFTGSSNGFFGRFNNRDRLYTELRYDF